MQWTDEGIVLGSKRHGEGNAILELMTRAHGRHLGLVRGGANARLRPVLQAGNCVSCTWRARLDEHLGHYMVEALDARAASFLPIPHALYGMTYLAALCRLLPERDSHPQVHAALVHLLDGLIDPRRAAPDMVRFELRLLAELGFGLDLSACAASGVETDLVYVSPKSARAVSRQAGEPWKDKLLVLPAFLCEADANEPSWIDPFAPIIPNTRSPIANPSTPSPAASILPARSPPTTAGNSYRMKSFANPPATATSKAFTEAAWTRTSTSPGPATGSATSITAGGTSNAVIAKAFTGSLLRSMCEEPTTAGRVFPRVARSRHWREAQPVLLAELRDDRRRKHR